MIDTEGLTTQIQLVRTAQAGDAEAMTALWSANRRWVAAVLLAHKPRCVDVEDLLQDVAMTLVTRIDSLREPAFFKAWLRQVAVNAARAAGRSSKVKDRAEGELRLSATTVTSADDSTVDEETAQLLGLVDGLPDNYREPLMLRAVQGLRSDQIGEILDLPKAVVDTRVARARRMLRDRARLLETDGHTLKWTGDQ